MSGPLRLRVLTLTDLPFADALRSLAGWNQTLGDWERFLILSPDGCFLAEWNGAPAGTATTTVYGRELAWIGMVLVHPDYRRRGIGQALVEKCLEHLRHLGTNCIKLDATPQGKPVYDRLEFKDEWTLTRWERSPDQMICDPVDAKTRNWIDMDIEAINDLDTRAFGVSRKELVPQLTAQACNVRVLAAGTGHIAGYGLLRKGAQALYLGPVVAVRPEAGIQIIEALLECTDGERVFWDIPDKNTAAVTLARQHGFNIQRALTRLYLGENRTPGNPALQFAIAGPELG